MEENDLCYPDDPSTDFIRVLVTCGFGTAMCLLGICLNSFLLLVFSRLSFHNNNFLYLYVLAFFDIIVEICFILIFSVSAYYDYFRNYEMYVVWHSYLRIVSTVGQVLILASSMLIVAASFERYLTSQNGHLWFSAHHRLWSIMAAVVYASAVKGTVFIELKIVHNSECEQFWDWHVHQSELVDPEGWYCKIWMFYARNILSVFLPFVLLTMLNSATIKNLNKTSKHFESIFLEGSSLQLPSLLHLPPEAAAARQRKRDATRTLAALVSVYLCTNVINVMLTFWEHIDRSSLVESGDGWLYRYLADVSSLLTISGTSVRLLIYYSCNREIRYKLIEHCADCSTSTVAKQEEKEEIV